MRFSDIPKFDCGSVSFVARQFGITGPVGIARFALDTVRYFWKKDTTEWNKLYVNFADIGKPEQFFSVLGQNLDVELLDDASIVFIPQPGGAFQVSLEVYYPEDMESSHHALTTWIDKGHAIDILSHFISKNVEVSYG